MTKEKKQDEKLNLYQKLIEIRKSVPFLKKGTTARFPYVNETCLLIAIRPLMDELGVILEMDMMEPKFLKFNQAETRNGGQTTKENPITQVGFRFTWINAENPTEKIEKVIYLESVSGDAQKMGGLMTYALRYFITKNLNIPTGEKEIEDYMPADVEEEFISKKQEAIIDKMINGNVELKTQVLSWLGIQGYHQIKSDRFEAVLNSITEYNNKKGV